MILFALSVKQCLLMKCAIPFESYVRIITVLFYFTTMIWLKSLVGTWKQTDLVIFLETTVFPQFLTRPAIFHYPPYGKSNFLIK